MVLEKGDYEIGSTAEIIAMYAKQKLNKIRRLETLIIAQSNLTVANAVINPQEVKFENVNKLITEYTEAIFPELAKDREDAAAKVKEMITKESNKVLLITQNATAQSRTALIKRR